MAEARHKQSCSKDQKLLTDKTYKRRLRIDNVTKVIAISIFLSVNLIKLAQCSELNNEVDSEKVSSLFSDVYRNGTFTTGNSLWDNILNQCSVKPTVSCLQKNVYGYLDDSLKYNGEIKVGGGISFKKNKVEVSKYTNEANLIYLKGSNEDDKKEFEEGRELDDDNLVDDRIEESETPLEEVTDALYDRSVNFLATHDMKLALPEVFFHGATLKISPRALTKTGALVHVELQPKEETGRLFLLHKLKKFIKRKLVLAAIAIILVVKLIALKLVFVLPIIFGVTTAKKMFLKLLLFLFPALSHIFKLCSWYHQSYHGTKLHHHHHLITHHHHKPPHHGPVYGPPSHHHGSVTIQSHHGGHPPQHGNTDGNFEHYPQDWELSGPGLGSEYIASDIHRNAINNFKPHANDANDINSWGLGLPPGSSMNVGEIQQSPASNSQPNVLIQNGRPGLNSAGRPTGPSGNPFHRNKKVSPKDPEKEALIRAAALAARAPPSPVRDEILRVSAAKLSESNRIKTEAELVRQQQNILAAQDPDTQAAEKFYGPLLDNIDKILNPMGAIDRGCKERAVCVLYRDPFAHTPYSNLVSNELSKESNELIPPADSKIALRYYRYVQAARDGQEQNDCVSLYPNCNVDFKKK